jgi:hypothetical protein
MMMMMMMMMLMMMMMMMMIMMMMMMMRISPNGPVGCGRPLRGQRDVFTSTTLTRHSSYSTQEV